MPNEILQFWAQSFFKPGEVMPRSRFAKVAGMNYSTAKRLLEAGVKAGALNKRWGISPKGQYRWEYALPETMPELPMGLTLDEEMRFNA